MTRRGCLDAATYLAALGVVYNLATWNVSWTLAFAAVVISTAPPRVFGVRYLPNTEHRTTP